MVEEGGCPWLLESVQGHDDCSSSTPDYRRPPPASQCVFARPSPAATTALDGPRSTPWRPPMFLMLLAALPAADPPDWPALVQKPHLNLKVEDAGLKPLLETKDGTKITTAAAWQ